jgi:hypothetical protein
MNDIYKNWRDLKSALIINSDKNDDSAELV